jgi:hypothetical protein
MVLTKELTKAEREEIRRPLRRYLASALRRSGFRFSQLNGLIDDGVLGRHVVHDLILARAFRPQEGLQDFMSILSQTPSQIKRDIDLPRKLRGLQRKYGVGNPIQSEDLESLYAKIQEIFLKHGIHAVFRGGTPSVGLILATRDIGDIPAYFFIDESTNTGKLWQGRLRSDNDGAVSSIEINLTANIARLVEVLSLWLMTSDAVDRLPGTEEDRMMVKLSRVPRNIALEYTSGIINSGLTAEELPTMFALNISCLRLIFSTFDEIGLETIATDMPSPQEFFRRVLNRHLNATLAHEVAHLEERTAGHTNVPVVIQELIAYLGEAVYSDTARAFLSMRLRGFDLQSIFPDFDQALRDLGAGCVCVSDEFLSEWALKLLNMVSRAGYGVPHDRIIDVERISGVQTSDFVKPEDMPLIERAAYNPSLKARRVHRIFAAEPTD